MSFFVVKGVYIPKICKKWENQAYVPKKKHDMNTRRVEKYKVEFANTERKKFSHYLHADIIECKWKIN